MKGYNLPDNVSPHDPEAPWNEEEQEKLFCVDCGVEMDENNTACETDDPLCMECWKIAKETS